MIKKRIKQENFLILKNIQKRFLVIKQKQKRKYKDGKRENEEATGKYLNEKWPRVNVLLESRGHRMEKKVHQEFLFLIIKKISYVFIILIKIITGKKREGEGYKSKGKTG